MAMSKEQQKNIHSTDKKMSSSCFLALTHSKVDVFFAEIVTQCVFLVYLMHKPLITQTAKK